MSSAVPLLKNTHYGFKTNVLVRNLSISFVENVVTKGLSFFTILVLTRMLGPEDYGKYSFVFVMVALCSALFDFGMENTAVRFASRDKRKLNIIFGMYLMAKLVILTLLVLFILLAGKWALGLIGKGQIEHYIPFVIVGLIGESLYFVNDTYLQAAQAFNVRAILNIFRYSALFLYVVMLMGVGKVTLDLVLYVYCIPMLFSLLFLKRYLIFIKSYLSRSLGHSFVREILKYEQWMFVYSIAGNLLGRIDFIILGFWVGFQQLGIYNAAVQLCAVVSFLPLAFGKVLLPVLSELRAREIFISTGKIIQGTAKLAVLAMILIPVTSWVVPWLLGSEYAASVSVLQILLLAFIISLLIMPYEQALYSLGEPKIMCLCRYLQLTLIITLSVLTIPILGIYGAALSSLLGRLLYLLLIRLYYRNYESRLMYLAEVNL